MDILEKDNPWSMDQANERIKFLAHQIRTGMKFDDLQQLRDFISIGSAAAQKINYGDTQCSADHISNFLEKKHKDYSPNNILRFGTLGVWVRISDKLARWENLTQNGFKIANYESLNDTYTDIFGYCIIGIMLLDGTFTLPVEEP